MSLFLAVVVIFTINIFFGYWRNNTRRFSIQWVMAIHAPVPLVIGIRFWLLGWDWATLPLSVAAYFGGQYAGSRLRDYMDRRGQRPLSSCLVMDLVRRLSPAG